MSDRESERVAARGVLYGDPVIGGEFLDRPIAVEAAQTRVLLTAERRVGLIVDRNIVDVRHARTDATGELHATLQAGGEHGAGQAVLAAVCQFESMRLVA